MTTNISLASSHRLSSRIPFPIVNFQYADDTVLIISAKGINLHLMMLVIHCFTVASGLKVNYGKSSFVPISIPDQLLRPIEEFLNCKLTSLPITYLGMPLTIKKPTKLDFLPLLEKLERRLQGWRAKLISRAGKLQLTKSVLSMIPMYSMSCFKFPKWLIDRIDYIRRQFLWARESTARPIHLINWRVACLPTKCGGMGIIDLQLQNMALLLRWWWRLYAGRMKLWATYATMIYAATSISNGPLVLSVSGSFFWKALYRLRPIFSNASQFRLGSGRHVSFWFDAWGNSPLAGSGNRRLAHRNISVYEARQRVHILFPRPLTLHHHSIIQRLLQFTPTQANDQLRWNLSASGEFSVRSIYKILSQAGKVFSDTADIWRTAVTPSMRVFFYLLLKHRLLTHDVMLRRNISFISGCVMCDRRHLEDVMHLFFNCPYAVQIWSYLNTFVGTLTIADSVIDTYRASVPITKVLKRSWLTFFITALWFLWKERNERTFRQKKRHAQVLATTIIQEANLYLKLC